MVQRARIPVLLLTGFLGSGKTSLLARWLRAPAFAHAMVIVNELGEVGLDDSLVQFSSEAPVLLENGCACCEAAEDLTATLERLFWQRLHRQIPKFEWMLIETTGIADPAPIMASLVSNDIVAERYCLAGVVTAFDARRGPEQILQHPECRSQVMQADVIIITKTDLASGADIANARSVIANLRPDAAVFESAQGDLPAAMIVESLHTRTAAVRVKDAALLADHSTDVSSAFAALAAPVEWENLEHALHLILQRYGKRILRLKGIAHIKGAAHPQVIQASHGEAVERLPLPVTGSASDKRAGLTIITQFVPAELVARDFLSMLKQEPGQDLSSIFPQRIRG